MQEQAIPASKVLGALSFALDLTDGQTMGHSMQTCVLGMRIAQAISLPPALQADLFYALLLKDAGCSSNASKLFHLLQSDEIQAKRNSKTKDLAHSTLDQLRYAIESIAVGQPIIHRLRRILHVARCPPVTQGLIEIRCERGASIARRIGFSLEVAEAIASLDEHWDGNGYPMHLTGQQIPLLSRIMNLAQNIALFWNLGGPKAASAMLKRRFRRWFDPDLVRAALPLTRQPAFFHGLDDASIVETVASFEPGERLHLDDHSMNRICDAFAEVIDTKSPFTFRHSTGVAQAAVAIAQQLGLPARRIVNIRRASLLHDIGKLSVPNSILEKPGKLNADEWQVVRQHPYYTLQILRRIPGFEELSHIAASHHERLDGTGYFRNFSADQLSLEARILAVADVYDALAAKRPYRAALPREKVFSIMQAEAPHALDQECLEALQFAREDSLSSPEYDAMPFWTPTAALPHLEPQYA